MIRPRLPSLLLSLVSVLAGLACSRAAEDDSAELAQARATFERDVEFATAPIRDRYVARLEKLKRSLGTRGDARAALSVQEEIDRVKAGPEGAAGFDKFAGIWNLTYSNGTKRTYSISREGSVTFKSENGALVPSKSAPLQVKNGDVIFDIGDNSIQRISLSGGKLQLDDFYPQSTYPAGPVVVHATGTRVSVIRP